MPHVQCPSCKLSSYVAPPHSAHPLCPYCDTDLLGAVLRPSLRRERDDDAPPAQVA